jgi:5-methylcytosine-specific restriction endonuclease McrA
MTNKQQIRENKKSSDRVNRSIGYLSGKQIGNMETQNRNQQKEEYGSLLQRPEWQSKRATIIKRDGSHCLNCGSTNNLQVHHRQYHTFSKTGSFRRPWDYKDKYLITLCLDCHHAGHKYFKVPVFNV